MPPRSADTMSVMPGTQRTIRDARKPKAPRRRCGVCSYNLFGLPAAGTCPECGNPYFTRPRPIFRPLPPYAWLLLGIAPVLTVLSTFWIMKGLPYLGILLIFSFGVPLIAGVIAVRLAEWRCIIYLPRPKLRDERPTDPKHLYDGLIVLFALLQIAIGTIVGVAYWALIPWMMRVGILPS
jgi:hypothetical protein